MADVAGQYIDELLASGQPFPSIEAINQEIMRRSSATSNRERQAMSRRAMSGRDPRLTDADRAAVARRAAASEENSQAVERGVGEVLLGQPIRAGKAIGEAWDDPSLANVTNAGAQAALTIPTLRGAMAAGGIAAGGLGTAAVSDILGPAGASAQGARNAAVSSANLPGLTPEQNAEYNRLQARMQKGAFGSAADRRATENRSRELRSLSDEFSRNRNTSGQAEYDNAVRRAETARDTILAERPRRFDETVTGQVYNKLGMASPAILGALGGGMTGAGIRAATGSHVWPAVGSIAVGGTTGAVAGNWPLAHELMYAPAANPERLAYQAYARELPPDHPRKAEWSQYAENQPIANPARKAALDDLLNVPMTLKRSALPAVEGMLGGLMATEGPGIVNRLLRGRNTAPNGGGGGGGNIGGGPGGNQLNVPPHPLANTQGRYPEPGSPGREFVRGEYRDQYSRASELPSPTAFNRGVQDSATAASGSLPNLQSRVRETNAAVRQFEAANGRSPMTDADWSQVFRMTRTLAIPALPAAGVAGYYGGTEQPPNALLQYRQSGLDGT